MKQKFVLFSKTRHFWPKLCIALNEIKNCVNHCKPDPSGDQNRITRSELKFVNWIRFGVNDQIIWWHFSAQNQSYIRTLVANGKLNMSLSIARKEKNNFRFTSALIIESLSSLFSSRECREWHRMAPIGSHRLPSPPLAIHLSFTDTSHVPSFGTVSTTVDVFSNALHHIGH